MTLPSTIESSNHRSNLMQYNCSNLMQYKLIHVLLTIN